MVNKNLLTYWANKSLSIRVGNKISTFKIVLIKKIDKREDSGLTYEMNRLNRAAYWIFLRTGHI